MKLKLILGVIIMKSLIFKNAYCMDSDWENNPGNQEEYNSQDSDYYDYNNSTSLEYNSSEDESFSQIDLNKELSKCKKTIENMGFSIPEKKILLLEQILFNKKITQYDHNLLPRTFTLSLEDSRNWAAIVIKSGYCCIDTKIVDFEINYLDILNLLCKNIYSADFSPEIIFSIINNMPSLENSLNFRWETINKDYKVGSSLEFYIPNDYKETFSKLLIYIGCKDLTDNFNFYDREYLLTALGKKICNFENEISSFLIKLVSESISKILIIDKNNITITGVNLMKIKNTEVIKLKSQLYSRVSHVRRKILDLEFEKTEENFDINLNPDNNLSSDSDIEDKNK